MYVKRENFIYRIYLHIFLDCDGGKPGVQLHRGTNKAMKRYEVHLV